MGRAPVVRAMASGQTIFEGSKAMIDETRTEELGTEALAAVAGGDGRGIDPNGTG